MKNKKGTPFIVLGLLLIAVGIVLAAYNLYDANRAAEAAQQAVNFLNPMIPEQKTEYQPYSVVNTPEIEFGTLEPSQQPEERVPSAEPSASPAPTEQPQQDITEIEIPDYVLNPEMDMPVLEHNGQDYIGVLEIPVLGLELPVISEWSYPRLKIAPCRYTGSIYTKDMVISAHNYQAHFGQLKNLYEGDRIIFTDADGNVFTYAVDFIETLSPYAIEDMTSGLWDLTLFTCTVGGSYRVTVRCDLVNETW